MKNLLLLAIFSGAVILNSGCSSKLMSFEKRKYNKGYHLDFTEKKNKKNKSENIETAINIPKKETQELLLSNSETTYAALPELITTTDYIQDLVDSEETVSAAAEKKEKQRFFQNPILKHFNGKKIATGLKRDFKTVFPSKNIASTQQTNGTSFFTILGAFIGGGSLIALTVMLFSSWASVALLIAFVSGCIFGLLLLILGANY